MGTSALSSWRSRAKAAVELLPESVGRPLTRVPFVFRLGPQYARSTRAMGKAEPLPSEEMARLVLAQSQALVRHAFEHVDFYRQHYQRHGFSPDDLQGFEDVSCIPVVTKADLQAVPIAARCAKGARGTKVNTGGTSGQPLEFLLDRHAFAREWAHMHHIWKAHGYRQEHLKLTFRGKHFDGGEAMRYNAVHNEYMVNANSSMSEVVEAVAQLPRGRVIRWLHGYPSLVAEFAHSMAALPAPELAAFQARLYGVLLGSEYPAPVYREAISETLSSNIVSWYGHSEMAILARETAHGVYTSYPTYGFAEAVPAADGNGHRLVCTSLHNRVHPFIRYDTGDLIDPVSQSGGRLSFRIREGRVGDFVLDRQGRKLALTAIIFGRHHAAFSMIQHVQVCDHGAGRIALIVTPKGDSVDPAMLMAGFDLADLNIDLELRLVGNPIRTPAGKIRLKVDPNLIS